MAEPIYKMFMARFSEAWYQLPREEQTSLLSKVNEALEKVGGKHVIVCDASWAAEPWLVFGVEEFPDIEAAQQHAKLLSELQWYRYCEATTLLGTALEPSSRF